jgi:pimeloyl-ACP methyl ester carboxylesterase
VERVETGIGTIAYRRVGTGSPLVLLHGGWSDGRAWTPQLAGLADEYDVVAWDAPGCGGSPDPPADLTLTDYADAVAALVVALGLGPVHLVGHSFGAGLAIEVQAGHPGMVRSLVLSGAYAGWRGSLPPEEIEMRLRRVLADLDRPPAEWVDGYLPGFFNGPIPAETVDAVRAMMLDVRPAGTRSMVTSFAAADLRHVLPTIAVPTLLLYGAEDVRAPRAVGEAMHASIPGSRMVLIPGVGHEVNLEAPEEFNAAVRSFLRAAHQAGRNPPVA